MEGVSQMKNLKWFSNRLLTLAFVFIPCLISCDNSSTESSTEPKAERELVGQWVATAIQGAIDANGNPLSIDGSVSTWTFNKDGTYHWFLHAEPHFNLEGEGTYSSSGDILTVTGIIANTLFSETPGSEEAIPITYGTNAFIFKDEDGDQWNYAKAQ